MKSMFHLHLCAFAYPLGLFIIKRNKNCNKINTHKYTWGLFTDSLYYSRRNSRPQCIYSESVYTLEIQIRITGHLMTNKKNWFDWSS